MTKDILKYGDIFWLDSDGNSIVIAENGGVYLVDENNKAHYLADDIRKIYDEESENYSINGMEIDEYIKSINKPVETTSVWTATAKITEPAVTSTPVRETKSEAPETVTEVPARVIYQTIYNGNSDEKITEETEKTEPTINKSIVE